MCSHDLISVTAQGEATPSFLRDNGRKSIDALAADMIKSVTLLTLNDQIPSFEALPNESRASSAKADDSKFNPQP